MTALEPAAGARQPERIDRCAIWLIILITIMLGVIPVRVAQIQLAPGAELREHIPRRTTTRALDARRGDLLDRRGRVLAASRDGWRVFVDPTRFEQPYGRAIVALADLTGMDESDVGDRILRRIAWNRDRMTNGRTPVRYVPIGGILAPDALERARSLGLPGVHLERRPVREVVGHSSLASIIGKVGIGELAEPIGRVGAELSFEAELQPEEGRLEYVRDARGRPMWIEPAGYRPARAGAPVRLSIDSTIQAIAEEELERGVEDADAVGGRLVVVDPLTGEVLAIVDHIRHVDGLVRLTPQTQMLASLDPDERPRFATLRDDPMREIEPSLARNRCVEDVYEPGSTMKPFVWAAISERGLAELDESIETHNGAWRTDFGRVIRDVTPRESLSWFDVLVYSSNIGMAQGALRVPGAGLREDLVRFGFGTRTGVGLEGESPGLVTSRRRWNHWTATSVCSGYEIAVTPVQMVRAFSAFARTGEMAGTLPTLSLLAPPPNGWNDEKDVVVRVVPVPVAEHARRAMVEVASRMNDIARQRYPEDPDVEYTMFGKSGTAEIVGPGGGGYLKGQHNSSFIAAAPADHPRLVVLVVIDDPGPTLVRQRVHYGSYVAGPVVRRVIRRVLGHMGVAESVVVAPQPASLSSP